MIDLRWSAIHIIYGTILLPLSLAAVYASQSSVPFQRASTDRPEYAWLTPITSRPTTSLAAHGAISVLCIAFRSWYIKTVASDSSKAASVPIAKRALTSVVAISAAILVVLPILLGLGAPLSGHFAQTFLLSGLVAAFTVLPVVVVFGLPSVHSDGIFDRHRLTRLLSQFRPEDRVERALVFPLIGSLLGCWVGVIPLALDWDRPWQTYPLPPALGITVGHIVGTLAGSA